LLLITKLHTCFRPRVTLNVYSHSVSTFNIGYVRFESQPRKILRIIAASRGLPVIAYLSCLLFNFTRYR